MMAAAEAMQQMLPGKLGSMPSPLAVPTAWTELWCGFPGQWHALLRALQRTVVENPTKAAEVLLSVSALGFPAH